MVVEWRRVCFSAAVRPNCRQNVPHWEVCVDNSVATTASLAKWLRRPRRERKIRRSNPTWDGISQGRVTPVTYTLALQWLSFQAPGAIGSALDWSARCQYTVTGWGRKCDLQLLTQCGSTYNCLSRSVPEIHQRVAGPWNVKQPPDNNCCHVGTGPTASWSFFSWVHQPKEKIRNLCATRNIKGLAECENQWVIEWACEWESD